jgi:DNA-binding transcriptional regulator YiaG
MSTAILDAMPKATPLADWIHCFRLHLDLTQVDFAAELHTTPSTVPRWESGIRQPTGPTLLLMARLALETGFEAPPDVVLGRGPRRP